MKRQTAKLQQRINKTQYNLNDRLETYPSIRFIRHFAQRFSETKLTLLAAGLTYYACFSIGPLILLLAGGIALFLNSYPEITNNYREVAIHFIEQIMPLTADARAIIEEAFSSLMNLLKEGALLRSIFSLVMLIWSSSNFFNILQKALDSIFEDVTPRNFLQKRLVAVLLVGTVALVIFFEVIGLSLVKFLEQISLSVIGGIERAFALDLEWDLPLDVSLGVLTDLYRVVIAVVVFTLCFQFLPRQATDWSGAFIGGLFSTTALMVTREMLPIFFNVDRFNLMYGFITSTLALLFWLYLSLQLFLIGALLAAEINYLHRELKKAKQDVQPRIDFPIS